MLADEAVVLVDQYLVRAFEALRTDNHSIGAVVKGQDVLLNVLGQGPESIQDFFMLNQLTLEKIHL